MSFIPLRFGAERGAMPPLGPLLLAAVVRQEGWEVEVLDPAADLTFGPFSVKRFAEVLQSARGDVLALSVYHDALPLIVATLRAHPDAIGDRSLIVGGPGVTGVEADLLRAVPQIDAIVRGDGESAIRALLRGHRTKLLVPDGLYRRDHAGIPVGTGTSDREDLESIPSPSWNDAPPLKSYRDLPISSMRGCPYDCSFCEVIATFGRRVSRRPPALVASDIESGLARFNVSNIRMVDDTFNIARPHMHAICDVIRQLSRPVTFTAYARLELLDQRDVEILAQAGCVRLFLGVDAIDPDAIRPLSKGYSREMVRDRIWMVADHGISVSMSMVFGFPDEDLDVFELGLALAEEAFDTAPGLRVWPQYSLLCPSLATPMYDAHAEMLRFDPDVPLFSLGNTARTASSSDPDGPSVLEVIRSMPRLGAAFWRFESPCLDRKLDEVATLRDRVESRQASSLLRDLNEKTLSAFPLASHVENTSG